MQTQCLHSLHSESSVLAAWLRYCIWIHTGTIHILKRKPFWAWIKSIEQWSAFLALRLHCSKKSSVLMKEEETSSFFLLARIIFLVILHLQVHYKCTVSTARLDPAMQWNVMSVGDHTRHKLGKDEHGSTVWCGKLWSAWQLVPHNVHQTNFMCLHPSLTPSSATIPVHTLATVSGCGVHTVQKGGALKKIILQGSSCLFSIFCK